MNKKKLSTEEKLLEKSDAETVNIGYNHIISVIEISNAGVQALWQIRGSLRQSRWIRMN